MRGDWIAATGQNGSGGAPGTGTFTLIALSPWINFNQKFGTTGNPRFVDYVASDGTNYEEGIGLFTPGAGNTATLTRIPTSTYSGGVFTETGTISSVNFTAAPTVEIGVRSRNTRSTPPGVPTSLGDGYGDYGALGGWLSAGATLNSAIALTPFLWESQYSIKSAAIYVDTAAAGALVRAGLYDWGNDGLPHDLICDFTATTQFDASSAGWKVLTAPTSFSEFNPPPGYYFMMFYSNGNVVLHGETMAVNTHLGTSGNRMVHTLGGSTTQIPWGPLPASIPSGACSAVNTSNGATHPSICLK